MIRIQRVLAPVDFSDASKKAVGYGLSLALRFQCKLFLAHVIPNWPGFNYAFPTESFEIEKKHFEDAKIQLPLLIAPEYRDRINLETIVRGGDIQEELISIMKEENIDLVVMGTHGRRSFERFFLGSVTERMLRKLPVPVLTVSHLDAAHDLHRGEPVPLGRIVYATDLTDDAEDGLHYAAELARGVQAELAVLHVHDAFENMSWGTEVVFLPADVAEIRHKVRKRLEAAILPERSNDLKIAAVYREGKGYAEILRYANETKADLVILNLHGKSRLERALLGSTAERVIRSATVPVLSLPAPATYVTRLVKESANSAA